MDINILGIDLSRDVTGGNELTYLLYKTTMG